MTGRATKQTAPVVLPSPSQKPVANASVAPQVHPLLGSLMATQAAPASLPHPSPSPMQTTSTVIFAKSPVIPSRVFPVPPSAANLPTGSSMNPMPMAPLAPPAPKQQQLQALLPASQPTTIKRHLHADAKVALRAVFANGVTITKEKSIEIQHLMPAEIQVTPPHLVAELKSARTPLLTEAQARDNVISQNLVPSLRDLMREFGPLPHSQVVSAQPKGIRDAHFAAREARITGLASAAVAVSLATAIDKELKLKQTLLHSATFPAGKQKKPLKETSECVCVCFLFFFFLYKFFLFFCFQRRSVRCSH